MPELEKAVKILTDAVQPICDTETIPLLKANGKILAEDIIAPGNQPPFPRSPLDGYAVRGEDTDGASSESPVSLKVIGKIYAGETFSGKIEKNECVRLMTGAPIPAGANAVIRQEDTDCGETTVRIYRGKSPYQNYCYEGEDYKKGDLLAAAGTSLSGPVIGVIAGTGREEVKVFRAPVITVISTGDELVMPGKELSPGKIYDSNLYLVVGRLRDLGIMSYYALHAPDHLDIICAEIETACMNSDLVITTGGVSVGEKDLMHQTIEELHAQKLFWRVNLKPGAPTLAYIANKTPVICLTGNPYGVAVNFELLVRPVLAKLMQDAARNTVRYPAVLENDSPKHGGVRRFMRGFFSERTDEHFHIVRTVTIPEGNHASGSLSSIVGCNCLAEIPEDSLGKKGEKIWIYPL